MREIKANESSRRKAGYASPSVRIIDVRMRTSVLNNESNPSYIELDDGGNN